MKISIKYKFLLGFFVIFSISLICFNTFMKNVISKNNENTLEEDMSEIYKSSIKYLNQYLIINEINIDKSNLNNESYNISRELVENYNADVYIHNLKGELISKSISASYESEKISRNLLDKVGKVEKEDLNWILKNRSTLRINNINNKLIGSLSYPLYSGEEKVGIITLIKDYTNLVTSSQEILDIFTYSTIIIFIVIFIFSYILSLNITRPIIKLTKGLKEVGKGNYNTDINITNKDEVGQLSKSFNNMKNQIKDQIRTIEEEKDKVLKLQETRTEFFNNVTHELKTPLTTISGYAQIMNEEGFEDMNFVKRASKKIEEESERLHNMVIDLIEISKKDTLNEKLKFEKVQLENLVTSICEDMSFKANKYNMKLIYGLEDSYVFGNKNKLKEVFINIIDNAVKYGTTSSEIKVKSFENEKHCTIIIENSSENIPKSKVEKMFDPFFRITSNHINEKGSSGLGLFICKNIIEEHNGIINLENKENKTKVTIKIPLWQQFSNN
ncbi:sensor signal transduction histidine kinase [Gottschalkia acidurici 9a]|uniref:histidine kinase n=1 Tax=Gottschalkia acidurici (strain ATCC 7906 / DSM 604 / BCRC 14475 / CIP 104303 / KCTC 5404 / NCIMB 10678 / 9a) TaxID=1128398 RepID=K0B205_GOTA9|nr:HAMP domain-containing sensor histidine kinase [Gottschalkia acidurici]AFS79147.1 sensor signal transduction histidine kinase [Gottschalkia acidurici 9a]